MFHVKQENSRGSFVEAVKVYRAPNNYKYPSYNFNFYCIGVLLGIPGFRGYFFGVCFILSKI